MGRAGRRASTCRRRRVPARHGRYREDEVRAATGTSPGCTATGTATSASCCTATGTATGTATSASCCTATSASCCTATGTATSASCCTTPGHRAGLDEEIVMFVAFFPRRTTGHPTLPIFLIHCCFLMLVAAACGVRGRLGRHHSTGISHQSRYCTQYPHCIHMNRNDGRGSTRGCYRGIDGGRPAT